MKRLYEILVLILLMGFYFPSYAAIDGFEPVSCDVFSDKDKDGDKKPKTPKDGEEEPDCE